MKHAGEYRGAGAPRRARRAGGAREVPAIVARVAGVQRIILVSPASTATELQRLRKDLGAEPVVLAAPTGEAKRVVGALGVDPQVEALLAPVRFPEADRGHRLDDLVRRIALRDRFRDVVVVTDPATTTLLLRVLAPGELATGGAMTVVGLPRGDRPLAVRRTIALGLVIAVCALVARPFVPILLQPAAVATLGLALLLVRRWQPLGRELLLAAGVALGVVFLGVAGSARFPGGW